MNSPGKQFSCIRSKKATHYLVEENIIKIEVKQGAEIEEEDIIEMHRTDNALAQGKKYALLIDSSIDTNITPAARVLSASPELSTHRIAKAIIVNNLAQRIIGNVYINFHKPITPTRLFTNTTEALEWLRAMIRSSNSTG